MTKKEVKAAFDAIGYKVKVKKINMIDRSWYCILLGIDAIDNSNVYTPALYAAHQEFFTLRNSFNKVVLDDGLSIVV